MTLSPIADRDDRFRLLRLITGHWIAQTVRAVAELSIADHLAAGPRYAEDIAAIERSDPEATVRLLRACVGIDLVTVLPDERFAATPLLDLLRSDAPGSLRDTALTMAAPKHWPAWTHFPDAIRTGTSTMDHNPEIDIFAAALPEPELAALIDTTDVDLVADLGGGNGGLVHALLHRDPALRGLVLELPHAVDEAIAETRRQGLTSRCTIQPGDFFTTVPKADLYLLKLVLRDWNDDMCVRLLRACRRAMAAGARLVVLDFVPGPDVPLFAGLDRDLAEFDQLFAAARLRRRELVTVRGGLCVIEVAPIEH
ncbi:MAG TPA: methyltransferase [Pseudonocardiaceae bacterium]|nr:methyltransferase [Pseudonocardiaceae bacterium]